MISFNWDLSFFEGEFFSKGIWFSFVGDRALLAEFIRVADLIVKK